MNRFGMGPRNLANRLRGNTTNRRTRRPRPGMNMGGPRPRPGIVPRPRPGMNMGGPRPGIVRRPRVPGGAGMDYSAMLGQLNRVPGGMSPGPMGRPRPRPGVLSPALRGGTAATGGRPPRTGMQRGTTGSNPFAGRQMFAEGGEVLKTPVDKLPNEGLKKLAKSPKGRKAVARMGFKDGGIAKGGKCPSRGTIRGTGAAIRGVGFKGVK